ncbi:MAG: cytochrome c maturation protein CcmE [Gammaproteobacteria bacterium]|nr:cytochrome c maturation protein CcmE [Pseudomonadota bacterium]TDJ35545.1 MAG: cytochrome c maturation protein CcmE [Gammaproteobacteria bacterium]
MHPKRRTRLFTVLFLFAGAAISVAFVLVALNENINMFYPPEKVVGGVAPVDTQIRAGGMVLEGSIARVGEELDVRFVLTDYQGSQFPVIYSGILPDLFREGQGVLVQGRLDTEGIFRAHQVLAKHDENYMPPELADLKGMQNK